jgi:hypothetical protein
MTRPALTLSGISVAAGVDDKRMVATTTLYLRAIAEWGIERNYNRKLTELDDLDPNGVHILSPLPTSAYLANPSLPYGYHDRAEGQPAPPHIRCQAWLKLRNRRDALEVTVDVPLELWPRDSDLVDGRRRWTVHHENLLSPSPTTTERGA